MPSSIERWVQGRGNLWFGRDANGTVVVAVMEEGQHPTAAGALPRLWLGIEEGIWASIVLSLTAFSERPNDWHAFLAHHQGKLDLMEAGKKLQTIQNILRL